MADSLGSIRRMAYGGAAGKVKPQGSGLGSQPRANDLIVRKSRPKRLATALRRGFGLG